MNSGKYLYKSSINKDSKMKKQNLKQMNNGSKSSKKVKKEEISLINKKKKREEEKINNKNKNEINQNIYNQGIPIENQMSQINFQNMYYQYYQNQMLFNQYMPQEEHNYNLKEIADKIYSRGIVNNIIAAFFIDKCIEDEKRKNKEEDKLEEKKIISKSEEKELSSENENKNNNIENNEQNSNEIKNDENINIENKINSFQNENKLIKPILVW